MNKVRFIVLCLLFIPFSVFANEISISCPSKINLSDSVVCSVSANLTTNSDQIAFMYQNDNVLFESFTPSNDWRITEGGTNSSRGVVLSRDNEVNGSSSLGTITYKSLGITTDFSIRIYGFDATNSRAAKIDFSNSESISNIHINHTNNYLKSLVINGEGIGFNKDTLGYSYSSSSDTVTISGVLDDETAYCENLSRTVKLNDGNNVVEYSVKAENGVIRTYRINILYNEVTQDSNNSDNSVNPNSGNSNNTTNVDRNTRNSGSNSITNDSDLNNVIDDTNTDEPEVKDLDTNKKADVKKNDDKKIVDSKIDSNDSKLGKKLNLLLLGLGIVVVIVSIVLIKKNKDQLYKN